MCRAARVSSNKRTCRRKLTYVSCSMFRTPQTWERCHQARRDSCGRCDTCVWHQGSDAIWRSHPDPFFQMEAPIIQPAQPAQPATAMQTMCEPVNENWPWQNWNSWTPCQQGQPEPGSQWQYNGWPGQEVWPQGETQWPVPVETWQREPGQEILKQLGAGDSEVVERWEFEENLGSFAKCHVCVLRSVQQMWHKKLRKVRDISCQRQGSAVLMPFGQKTELEIQALWNRTDVVRALCFKRLGWCIECHVECRLLSPALLSALAEVSPLFAGSRIRPDEAIRIFWKQILELELNLTRKAAEGPGRGASQVPELTLLLKAPLRAAFCFSSRLDVASQDSPPCTMLPAPAARALQALPHQRGRRDRRFAGSVLCVHLALE